MRAIDADALRKQLDFGVTGTEEFDKGYDIGVQTAIEMIDNAPTVERPTGEWELYCDVYECSVCHKFNEYMTSYCPECGAKMKVGEEDETD